MKRMARTAVFSLLALSALAALPAEAQRRACPRIASVSNDPLNRSYRAGDTVPAELLDPPFAWSQCEAPSLPAGAARGSQPRVVFLSVTVDETGAVTDARPRGAIDPEGYYDAAVATIRNWRTNKPQWRGLPVKASIAVDVGFARAEAPAELAATPPQASTPQASSRGPSSSEPVPTAVPANAPSEAFAAQRPPESTQAVARECPRIAAAASSGATLTRTYEEGDVVPAHRLDALPAWGECHFPANKVLVMLVVTIGEAGSVTDVKPRAPSAEFEEAARAVRMWKATPPPRFQGKPVKTMVSVDIRPAPAGTYWTKALEPSLARGGPEVSTQVASTPQQVPPQARAAGEPFVVEYYYKVKWGFAEEFWRLFNRNHWPLLRKQMEMGRILEVRAASPRYHATEEGRWDYRVTIVFRSAAEANAPFDTESLERQLFPDLEGYRREERRRFELLLAHWDVPVVAATLEP